MKPTRFKRAIHAYSAGEPGSSGLRGITSDANMKQLRANEKLKDPVSIWRRKPKAP